MISTERTTKAHKTAAVFLLINAAFVLIGVATGIEDESRIPTLLVSSLLDVLIAVALLRDKPKWIPWATVRVVIGLLAYSALALVAGDYWILGVQLLLSVSLLLLLLGNAGKARRIVSTTMFSVVTIVYLLGTVLSFAEPALLTSQYSLVTIEESDEFDLPSLSQEWKMRERGSYTLENPDVDLWLINPEHDSHIMVIHEQLTQSVDHSILVEVVKENARAVGDLTVISKVKDTYGDFERTLMTTENVIDGSLVKYSYSLLSTDTEFVQIICFALEGDYESAIEDFETFIDDFSMSN